MRTVNRELPKKCMFKMAKIVELELHVKYVSYKVFIVNFMFVLFGFLFIFIGSTIITIYKDFNGFLADHYYEAPKTARYAGVTMLFAALPGCIGAFEGSEFLVNFYALLSFCALILEVAVSVDSYKMGLNLEETIKVKMNETLYFYDSYTQYTWNATQYNLRCCGVSGPTDWDKFIEHNSYGLNEVVGDNITYHVPDTCCLNESCQNVDSVYVYGCLNKVTYIVSKCALLLSVVAPCISFIQLLGIIFFHLMARSLGRLQYQIIVEEVQRIFHNYQPLVKVRNNEKVSPVLCTPTSPEA